VDPIAKAETDLPRHLARRLYRLRVIPIFLPALRERREDVGLLCSKFIEGMNPTSRRRIERVAPSALSLLVRQDWPGNVRELRNVLAYAYAVGDGPILQPNDLPPELLHGTLGVEQARLARAAASPEAQCLLEVLERTGGNKTQAANILGMSRVTLWRRMQALGIAGEDAGTEPRS
jgi:two-component system response regulator AtoC